MDAPVLAAIERDESYRVVKVLASKPSGMTELVGMPGSSVFYVRKRIPIEIANQEAWTQLAAIHDRRLPHVVDMYALPDTFCAVCDYVEGFSIAQLVAANGALTLERARPLLADVCGAAEELHARGIIHRDITPYNVIVAADGAHLIDLGIARMGEPGARHDTTKLGTWGFAAPEQYGFAQTDARSDVYSIGCLAAYMLTGIRPDEEGFEGSLASLPPSVRAAIDKARSFEPSARFSSAAELLTAVSCAEAAARPGEKRRWKALSAIRSLFIPPREWLDAWNASTLLRKALLLLALPFWITLCGSLFSSLGDADPATPLGWVIADAIMKIMVALCISWMGFDALLAALGAGPYGTRRGRAALWAKRALFGFGIVVVAMFIIVSIATALFGADPNL